MSVKYIIGHKYFWVRIVPGLCVALMHPPTPRLLHWRLLFSPSGHASFESRCTFARSQCHTFCGCFKYFLFQLFQIIAKYAENSKTRKAWILPLLHFQFCTGSHKQEQTQANMTSSKEIFGMLRTNEKGDYLDRIVKHGWWRIRQRPFCCTTCCDALLSEAMRGQTVEIFNDLCNRYPWALPIAHDDRK